MAIFALSVAIADQYLAIPIIAAAIYWRSWPTWAFLVSGTIAVCSSPYQFFRQDRPELGQINLGNYSILYWSDVVYRGAIVGSQLCMLALLILAWRNRDAVQAHLSKTARVGRAALLLAAGFIPALAPYTLRVWNMIRGAV